MNEVRGNVRGVAEARVEVRRVFVLHTADLGLSLAQQYRSHF